MTFDHKSNITTNKNYNNNRNKKFNKENHGPTEGKNSAEIKEESMV